MVVLSKQVSPCKLPMVGLTQVAGYLAQEARADAAERLAFLEKERPDAYLVQNSAALAPIIDSDGWSGLSSRLISLTRSGTERRIDRAFDPLEPVFAGDSEDAADSWTVVFGFGHYFPWAVRVSQIGTGLLDLTVQEPRKRSEPVVNAEEYAARLLSSVLAIVEKFVLPATPLKPFRVFLGHGGDAQWKSLKLALESVHHFEIEAFESEVRAGYATLETVGLLIRGCNVGLIVMTGTDKMVDGSIRARENVVHEIGFSQGAVGIRNTIILLENGVSEFSNIKGVNQIRFPAGDILAAEAEVVEALLIRRRAHENGGNHPSA